MTKNLIENRKKIGKTKRLSAIAMIMLLIMVASLTACLPATATIPTNVKTTAWLSLRPNPIGIGQEMLVNGWTSPPPNMYSTMGITPPPGFGITDGVPRTGYWVTFTKPDGNVIRLGPITSDGPGTFWFTYKPDQLGTWTATFSWAGDANFLACSTTHTFVVQNAQVPSWPAAPLPTELWSYPINTENREWASISGGWFMQKYNESACNFNAYSTAPRSAHILWMLPPKTGVGGLIGGEYGTTGYYSKTVINFAAIIAGRGYASAGGSIMCVDIRTGQTLWTVPGSFTVSSIRGSIAGTTEYEGSTTGQTGIPALYSLGSRFIVYDGLTGAITLNVTGMSALGGSQGVGLAFSDPYVYSRQNTVTGGPRYFIKWTTIGDSTNFTSRILWNVTWPEFLNQPPENDSWQGLEAWGPDTMFQFNWPFNGEFAGFNLTNGQLLWRSGGAVEDPWLTSRGGNGYAYGMAICPVHARQLGAWNMTTGQLVWLSQKTADPWGGFWAYEHTAAYNMIYKLTYAGVYAFDAKTGKIVWYYTAGDAGMETPYAIQAPGDSGLEATTTVWPFYNIPVIADGVIFAATGEHSPTLPLLRGQRLHAIDAYTGKGIWSIMGYWNPTAIAEGTVFASNNLDGYSYAFAKGETATTVAVQNDVYTKGNGVLIKGTVTDQSPAQPGTAAVSDASMSEWMEYLHMQQPKPTNTTGVQVKLTAVKADGTTVNIGTTTSDATGVFGELWTPPSEGKWTITASFEGSNGYYASSAETLIGVGAAASAAPTATATPSPSATEVPTASPSTAPTPPGTTAGVDIYVITAVVAVIIVIVAVAAIILRRRK